MRYAQLDCRSNKGQEYRSRMTLRKDSGEESSDETRNGDVKVEALMSRCHQATGSSVETRYIFEVRAKDPVD